MSDFSEAGSHHHQQQQMDSPRARPLTPASCSSTPSPRSPASPVPNFTPSPAAAAYNRGAAGINNGGLSRSLSTTNLSSSSTTSNASRVPKGLMQKFIASRGKMTGSAFSSPPPPTSTTSRGIPTRPMRVEPKVDTHTHYSMRWLRNNDDINVVVLVVV